MSLHRLLILSVLVGAAWTAEPVSAPASKPIASQVPAAVRAATPVAKPEAKWMQHHGWLVERAQKSNVTIAFFGDSITHYWTEYGKEAWTQQLVPQGAADFGIGGDKVEHILWRMTNGELEGMRPKVVVLMAGTNNLWDYELKPKDIVAGIVACLATIRERQPQAKILLMGVIPQGRKPDGQMRPKVTGINALLAALPAHSYDAFIDLGPKLLAPDGVLPELISADQTHLTKDGYAIWLGEMEPVLKGLLKP